MTQAAFVRAEEVARDVNGQPPRAVFAESNAPGVDDGVMDIAVRHKVLYRCVALVAKYASGIRG